MTKSVLNAQGTLFINVRIESQDGTSTEEGQSTSSNLKNVYSKNVKPNINRLFKGAVLNAIGNHIYKFKKQKLYNYYDYQVLIRDNFKKYTIIDYDIKYEGVEIKRIKKKHKYYTQVKDKKTKRVLSTTKWRRRNIVDIEQEFLEDEE